MKKNITPCKTSFSYLIKASQQVGMTDEDGNNVLKIFQIKTNLDNAADIMLKYKVVLIEM